MKYSFLVIDGDDRQKAISNYLQAHHYNCSLINIDYLNNDNLNNDELLNCNYCLRQKINTHSIIICRTPFKESQIINLLNSSHTLVGYGLKDEDTLLLVNRKISFIDLAKDDYFVWNNGYLTAEATLGKIITTIPFSILGSKCLICGYGNCGTHIATMISKLGGNVTIYDKGSQTMLKACSCAFCAIDNLDLRISDFDIIINTVPHNIFTSDNISYINKNSYIFDIASSPYGFIKAYRDTSSKYFLLPGLPGKIMPKSAGELIAKTVLNLINKKEQSYEI